MMVENDRVALFLRLAVTKLIKIYLENIFRKVTPGKWLSLTFKR